ACCFPQQSERFGGLRRYGPHTGTLARIWTVLPGELQGLADAGRYLVMRTKLPDRPGELIKLLSLVAEERANVIAVEHHREGVDVSVTETEIGLTLVTRDEEHCQQALERESVV